MASEASDPDKHDPASPKRMRAFSHAELVTQAQQVASKSEKHCRVTASRVLQKWSTVKGIVAGLQKKPGVYDEQAIGHSALPFTIVSGVQILHVLEEIDLPNLFARALRIITEVTIALDEVS